MDAVSDVFTLPHNQVKGMPGATPGYIPLQPGSHLPYRVAILSNTLLLRVFGCGILADNDTITAAGHRQWCTGGSQLFTGEALGLAPG